MFIMLIIIIIIWFYYWQFRPTTRCAWSFPRRSNSTVVQLSFFNVYKQTKQNKNPPKKKEKKKENPY